MFWNEEKDDTDHSHQSLVVDLQFAIDCPTLPQDHAWALSTAIKSHLPWFESDELSGLHLIHGAASGNGWERPQEPGELLNLPRRTKLCLRLPQNRVAEANKLCQVELNIEWHRLNIKQSKIKPLLETRFLYARYVAQQPSWGEDEFTQWAVEQLHGHGIRFKKMLCGREHKLTTKNTAISTRSLMVADLSHEDAFKLQEVGLGPERSIGCGIFLPQKSF